MLFLEITKLDVQKIKFTNTGKGKVEPFDPIIPFFFSARKILWD
jgi:hypothetical protein